MIEKIKRYRTELRTLSLLEKPLLILPVAVWFSYYPNLTLGRFSSTNLEVSIVLLFIALVALISLPAVWANRKVLVQNRAVWLSGAFVAWNCLSVVWAINPVRGLLHSSVWLLLWLCFLAMLSAKNKRTVVPMMGSVFVGSAALMSAIALAQVVYGAWVDWGLCAGCLARGFGFVRPSALAAEPQFLGSLLIAPIIMLLYRTLRGGVGYLEKGLLVLMTMALYSTLSRGAIYALLLAAVILIVIVWRSYAVPLRRAVVVPTIVVLLSFGMGMLWHGLFTQLNPRVTDGCYDAVAKSVNHLSLGKISLPKPKQQPAQETPLPTGGEIHTPTRAMFDGYVQRSTNERTILNDRAIKAWSRTAHTTVAGVGAGSAGRAMYQADPSSGWELEIVQNEYLSTLLELGIVGVVLFVAVLFGLFRVVRCRPWLWAILVGFIVQWNFFSGLPNALHIYLVCGVMVVYCSMPHAVSAGGRAGDGLRLSSKQDSPESAILKA
ncbi:MAG: O-antigen ligase family protein [Candidatus Saccharibacteria bacterium]|nr:O-antigen ligase family protein [Candidatus Saccharibacteria bacterium]